MIRYILRKIKNDQSPVFNRWFAYPVVEETVNLSNLAKHMASHNTPFIFSLGIKNRKGGAESEDVFTVTQNIEGVKFRARATGELMAKNLNLEASMKKAKAVDDKGNTTTQP